MAEMSPLGGDDGSILPAAHALQALGGGASSGPVSDIDQELNSPLVRWSSMDRLRGRAIIVVEDEPLIALDVARSLEALDCRVVGPVSTVADAMGRMSSTAIDAAVLDVNLGAEKTIEVMDTLIAGCVPFIIVTGYAHDTLPLRFQDRPYLGKPFSHKDLVLLLDGALRGGGASPSAVSSS